MQLTGKTALVTGAARRLGKAIALALAREGSSLAIHYHASEREALSLKQEIETLGRQAWIFRADLAEDKECAALIDKVCEYAGVPEILINNASVYEKGSLTEASIYSFIYNIRVNAWAPFALGRRLWEKGSHGVIINLLDARIHEVNTTFFEYHLSKQLLYYLTQVMAVAFAPRWRVNAVAPGPVLPSPHEVADPGSKLSRKLPLQHTGSPENVVEGILSLIKNEAITGQVLFVDSGRHLLGTDHA